MGTRAAQRIASRNNGAACQHDRHAAGHIIGRDNDHRLATQLASTRIAPIWTERKVVAAW